MVEDFLKLACGRTALRLDCEFSPSKEVYGTPGLHWLEDLAVDR
jgi:hypothetical protein